MALFFTQLLTGIQNGAVYASLAIALVLIFRTTGILNFAQGEMALFSTYVLWKFIDMGLAVWIAIIVTMAVSFVGGALIERIVIRPVEHSSPLVIVIVTIGLFLAINSLAQFFFGSGQRVVPSFWPHHIWRPGDVIISSDTLVMVAVLAVECLLLYLLLQRTKLGLAFRGVSGNAESSRLLGVPVGRILMVGWGLAAAVGALAGAMAIPTTAGLVPSSMQQILVFAFAAAAIGGFDSVFGAVVGGMIVGVADALTIGYVDALHGIDLIVPFGLILLVLLFRPAGLFGSTRRGACVMIRSQQRVLGLVVSVAVVAGLMVFFGWIFPTQYGATDTRLVAQAFYIGVAAMGLNILTGYNGQVSIGHGAFFGVGAYTTALLMNHEYTWFGITFGHMSFLATLLPCAIVTFVIGALVGFPALRVKGLYLALVTLGLAVIFPDLATRFVKGTGGTSLVALPPYQVAAPSWFPDRLSAQDQWAYMMAFSFAIIGVLVVWVIARSRFGRSLIAVRDHEAAASSVGIDLARTKVLAFALSAMYAGIAGSLSVLVVFNASADKVETFQNSIEFLVALVIGGTATVVGPLIGGFAVVYVDKWTRDAFPDKPVVSPATFGIALILLMYVLPEGVVGGARRLLAWSRRTLRTRRPSPAAPDTRVDLNAALPRGPSPMNDRRTARRSHRTRAGGVAVCLVVVALLASACGGNRSTAKPADTGGSGTTTAGTTSTLIDTSACPSQNDTTGVKGNTVTFGTSLPQSGLYAPFSNILHGEQAYFNYVNANGGVTVGGKKYQIKLKDYDDQYIASKTVTNVQNMLNGNNVFGLFNVVGTKNNLSIRDQINAKCVPDLFAASGATQWGNHAYPWLIGSELVPYPLEVKTFVDYLKKTKPDATIAVLKANDDFGQQYADTLTDLVKGTQLKVVKTEEYDNTGAEVKTQVNELAATHADAFLLAAALLACPASLNAAGDANWHPITYMSGTCVSKLLFDAAGKNANGVFTVTPLLDPADPKNDDNPAMKLYKQQFGKYFPQSATENDPKEGISAYGWTTAALLVKTLEAAKSLDRASVMESARHLQDVAGAGLQLPASKWNTNADDWFVGETYQFIKWDATAGHSDPVGPLTDEDGKTAELTPGNLINVS